MKSWLPFLILIVLTAAVLFTAIGCGDDDDDDDDDNGSCGYTEVCEYLEDECNSDQPASICEDAMPQDCAAAPDQFEECLCECLESEAGSCSTFYDCQFNCEDQLC